MTITVLRETFKNVMFLMMCIFGIFYICHFGGRWVGRSPLKLFKIRGHSVSTYLRPGKIKFSHFDLIGFDRDT